MCHQSAEKALDQLEILVKDDRETSAEIQKERLKMKEYKTRTGMCKN
jgi:hypothetical protein